MNHRTMEKIGESLKISFIAGRALLTLTRATKGQKVNTTQDRKALEAAIRFMNNVNNGRDVFRGESLSGSALNACTAYDLALRAMKSRAQSVLSEQSLEDFFADIEKSLEDLADLKPVAENKLVQSKTFFSWLMKSTSDETRHILENRTRIEVPEWLSK